MVTSLDKVASLMLKNDIVAVITYLIWNSSFSMQKVYTFHVGFFFDEINIVMIYSDVIGRSMYSIQTHTLFILTNLDETI